jgi:hypothetical protein
MYASEGYDSWYVHHISSNFLLTAAVWPRSLSSRDLPTYRLGTGWSRDYGVPIVLMR